MKSLDELLAEALSEMTDEEFDKAWAKVTSLEDEYGTSDTLL